jgi:type II secretory pathway pseudopilin PulG
MKRPRSDHSLPRSIRRRGFTIVELVVSASMLMVMMAFVTTLAFRIDQTWKDVAYQRIAINELSNHLDRLTQLPQDQLAAEIELIEVSAEVQRTLANPELSAQRIDDELGHRVVLKLDWQRRHPGRPVELVGWIPKEQNR